MNVDMDLRTVMLIVIYDSDYRLHRGWRIHAPVRWYIRCLTSVVASRTSNFKHQVTDGANSRWSRVLAKEANVNVCHCVTLSDLEL
jgi:hypothetical protein